MKARKKYIFFSVAALLLIWEGLSLIKDSGAPIPGPLETLTATYGILCNLSFLKTVGSTLLRALAGFVISAVIGGGFGIVAGRNEGFRAFMTPVLVLVRSTPVVVFVLMAIVWFSADVVPVLIGMLMMLPVVYLNVSEGMLSIDRQTVQMAQFYGVGGRRLIRELYLPAIRPFVLSGISNAVGLGWRAIVAAEVLSHPQWGIGTSMHAAQLGRSVDVLMAWAFVTVIFGALFEKILSCGYKSGQYK